MARKQSVFHQILLEGNYISENSLDQCLKEIEANPDLKLGRLLLDKKLLNEQQLRNIYNQVKSRQEEVINKKSVAEKQQANEANKKMQALVSEAKHDKESGGGFVPYNPSESSHETNKTSLLASVVIIALVLIAAIYFLIMPEKENENDFRVEQIIPTVQNIETANVKNTNTKNVTKEIDKNIRKHEDKAFERYQRTNQSDTTNANNPIDILKNKIEEDEKWVANTINELIKMKNEDKILENSKSVIETLNKIAGTCQILSEAIAKKNQAAIFTGKLYKIKPELFGKLLDLLSVRDPNIVASVLACLEKVSDKESPERGVREVSDLTLSPTPVVWQMAFNCLGVWCKRENKQAKTVLSQKVLDLVDTDKFDYLLYVCNSYKLPIDLGSWRYWGVLAEKLIKLERVLESIKKFPKQKRLKTLLAEELLSFNLNFKTALNEAPNHMSLRNKLKEKLDTLKKCAKIDHSETVQYAFEIMLMAYTGKQEDDPAYKEIFEEIVNYINNGKLLSKKIWLLGVLVSTFQNDKAFYVVVNKLNPNNESDPEIRTGAVSVLRKNSIKNDKLLKELKKAFSMEKDEKVLTALLTAIQDSIAYRNERLGKHFKLFYNLSREPGEEVKFRRELCQKVIMNNIAKLIEYGKSNNADSIVKDINSMIKKSLSSDKEKERIKMLELLTNSNLKVGDISDSMIRHISGIFENSSNQSEVMLSMQIVHQLAPDLLKKETIQNKFKEAISNKNEQLGRVYLNKLSTLVEENDQNFFKDIYFDMPENNVAQKANYVYMIDGMPYDFISDLLWNIYNNESNDKCKVALLTVLIKRKDRKTQQKVLEILTNDMEKLESVSHVPGTNITHALVQAINNKAVANDIKERFRKIVETREDPLARALRNKNIKPKPKKKQN